MSIWPESEVEAASGVIRGKHKPVKLKNWLEDNDFVLGETFFRRVDGWYSVMHPQARTSIVPVRPQVRRRA
jgi:hypothetical protein